MPLPAAGRPLATRPTAVTDPGDHSGLRLTALPPPTGP